MANPRVKLNLKAVNKIMRSPEVEAELVRHAKGIQSAAGEGFEVDSKAHRWVARVYVQTTDYASRREEAKRRTLSRAFGRVAGGGG